MTDAYQDVDMLCRLVSAAHMQGRHLVVEFGSYGALKRLIGGNGSARMERKRIEAMYRKEEDERLIDFTSRRLREQRIVADSGDLRKHCIYVRDSGIALLLAWYYHLQAQGLAPREAQTALDRLVEVGLMRSETTDGTHGKQYRRYSLAASSAA